MWGIFMRLRLEYDPPFYAEYDNGRQCGLYHLHRRIPRDQPYGDQRNQRKAVVENGELNSSCWKRMSGEICFCPHLRDAEEKVICETIAQQGSGGGHLEIFAEFC